MDLKTTLSPSCSTSGWLMESNLFEWVCTTRQKLGLFNVENMNIYIYICVYIYIQYIYIYINIFGCAFHFTKIYIRIVIFDYVWRTIYIYNMYYFMNINQYIQWSIRFKTNDLRSHPRRRCPRGALGEVEALPGPGHLGFPWPWGYPQMEGLWWKKMMIWGYPLFSETTYLGNRWKLRPFHAHSHPMKSSIRW